MKRTTIFLDEALERDLQAIARQERRAVASVVREAIAAYVVTRRDAGRAPALSFIGSGASGRKDIAERHEELLWPADPPAPKARKRVARPSRHRR
jgi:predicted transcriptional regulator